MRQTRVLTASLRQPEDPADRREANRDSVMAVLREAESYDPDFVCFPEWALVGNADSPYDHAVPVPGETVEAVADRAAALDSNVLLPVIEADGDAYRNTTVFCDRDGGIAEPYRKIRPTTTELDDGVVPGEETVVWETDHGPASTITCFDVNFQEVGLELARRKPRLVFFLSLFPGGDLLEGWARQYGFTIVKCTPAANAVVSPTGEVRVQNDDHNAGLETELSTGAVARLGCYDVNTDYRQCHIDHNVETFEAIREEYGGDVVFHKESEEAYVVLESVSESVTVEEIAAEFDLPDYRDYLDRSREACEEAVRAASPPAR